MSKFSEELLNASQIAYAEEHKQDLARMTLEELQKEANLSCLWMYNTTKVYQLRLTDYDYYLNDLLRAELEKRLK